MYKLLSGAKSVKQYRGDENLPEAKKGMKNCGCKHTRSKYKYQDGERDILADKIEGIVPKRNIEEAENLDYSIDYDLPKSVKSRLKEIKNSNIIPVKNTIAPRVIRKDTTPVKKDSVSRTQKKTYPTVSGEKRIVIEKTPVTRIKNTPKPVDRSKEYFDNFFQGEGIFPGNKKYQIVNDKMIVSKRDRLSKEKLKYDWEDLSAEEKNKVNNLYKQERRNQLQKEVNAMNSRRYTNERGETLSDKELQEQMWKETTGKSEMGNFKYNLAKNVKKITSAVEGKSGYKYGTGALTIPEGSAIVTANGGKNHQALRAYKKGNYKLLNNIIDDMPEDRVDKAQAGKKQVKKIAGKKSDDFQEEFVIGDPRYGRELPEKDVEELYALSDADLERSTKFSSFTKAQEKAKRAAARNKQETFTFTYKGKTYSGSDGKGYASGYKVPQQTKAEEVKTTPEKKAEVTQTPPSTQYIPPQPKQSFGKKLGNILQDIPSLAEIAARTSILGRGIDYSNIPENYLKLDKYNYASQLPSTLREIQLAEQAGRETSRDVLGGDAGRYLAQAGNLSASRMEAANKAVIQDTLARQDILNKNVDLTNVETQTNRALKDQYAAMRNQDRLKARAAYDEQLIGLGQRIDSAAETAREMSNQRAADEQRLQVLRDLGVNYDIKDIDGLLKLVPKTSSTTAAKGLKKAKTYKRR